MLPSIMTKPATTYFGDREVATEQKQALVGDVFSKVAQKYDIMNDLMSGGMHRLWKKEMVAALPRYADFRLLDLAGGTGDIAFRYLERDREKGARDKGHGIRDEGNAQPYPLPLTSCPVTICDINADMLREGQRRAVDRNLHTDIEWVCGNAESLPLEDNRYDGCTIAFGIRNVTHIDKALKDIYRVLKPGGVFLCLEFCPVGLEEASRKPTDAFYNLYSDHLIPRIGQMVTGDAQPYEYLVQSIRRFPKPDAFADKMRRAGFQRVSYRQMTHGVVALHKGWKC